MDPGVRAAVAAGARGWVLDLGTGTGLNLAHLGPEVEAVAVDPSPHMLRRARLRVPGATFVEARAEALPFADGSFDAVVATLVLCSVEDPARSLAEVRRVLRPGGELRFYEHVRARGPAAKLQDAITPLWQRVADGCHPNRDTLAAIAAAGFTLTEVEPVRSPPLPHVRGRALRRG